MKFANVTSAIQIPVIGIGTWGMGGDLTPKYNNDQKCIEALENAIKLGLTHIDTAEIYAQGHTEELVGQAIKSFDRKRLFITTKVAKENLSYDGIIKAMDDSLMRLDTPYVDLYLIHSSNPDFSIENSMRAMNHLVETNKTKFIGVSNFSVLQLKEAQKFSQNKIVANQIEYNLITRNVGQNTANMESDIIPFCQNNNILIIAYRPFARGDLFNTDFPILEQLSKKYGKTKAQIALNWLVSKQGVITIPKALNLEHLQEIATSADWQMNKEDLKKLDNFSR
ncbi:MAG: aldo/keto reductase [Patescibacteria group bacterium]